MSTLARKSAALQNWVHPAEDAVELSRLEARLPPFLSVIAGMVDLTGFFTLGHIFTAHITGNLVVAAAAAEPSAVNRLPAERSCPARLRARQHGP